MSQIKFTPSQTRAIEELSRDVSVSAGAGSGKTEVLVTRFCHIVESGSAKVDEILTVTFTEKAAREMKERIVARFQQKGMEAERRAVESAYIGTIHGFASRILRENAFEAGIDPNFSVMDEAQASAMSRDVYDELIDSLCRSGDRCALEMLEAFKLDNLYDTLISVHKRLCSLGLQANQVCFNEFDSPAPAIERFISAARDVAAFSGRTTPATDDRLRKVRESLLQIESALKECCKADEPFNWGAFMQVPAPKSLFPMSGAGVTGDLKPYMAEAQGALTTATAILLEIPAQKTASAIIHLVQAFQKAYQAAKHRTGTLDFDDLLMTTRDLLITDGQPTPTAAGYRDRFKFITVDEFQDTNPLQKQIIDAIRRPGRLFTVGDMKQSIYGFNNSDVHVFMDHHTSIDEAGRLYFTENFRSRANILHFVNWLFDPIFGEDGDIPFEALVPGRNTPPKNSPDIELLLVPAEEGRLAEARAICARIRAICGMDGVAPIEIQTKDGSARPVGLGDIVILLRTTTHISIYERALHEAGIPSYVVSGRGYFQTQEVRDILNVLKAVDNPLDDVNVAGILKSPMFRISDDALYWLSRDHSSIQDTDDDEEEFPVRNRNIGKLYTSLYFSQALGRLSADDKAKAIRFCELLERLQRMTADGRITDIIDTILCETGYERTVLAMFNGKRKYANIRKLYDLAQSYQSGSIFGLPGFIKYIEQLETVAERESEAPTETEGSGVVRVMTVHKAKGLEAPVVFVADMSGRRNNNRPAFVVDRNGVFSCKVWDPVQEAWHSPASFEAMSSAAKTEEHRELKRLLYVAATRARDLLIMSGCSALKGDHKERYIDCPTWLAAIEKALNLDSSVDVPVLIPDGGVPVAFTYANTCEPPDTTPVETLVNVYAEKIATGEPIGAKQALTPQPPLPIPGEGEKTDAVSGHPCPETDRAQEASGQGCPEATDGIGGECLSPSIGRGARGEGLSTHASCLMPAFPYPVSRLLDYLQCPKLYELKHKLGIEEDNGAEPEYEPDSVPDEQVSGAALGSRVHDVLRAAEFGDGFEDSVNLVVGECEEDIREQVKSICLSLKESDIYPELCRADVKYRETPFTAKVAGAIIKGCIDLLYKCDGKWTVLDYKTGTSDPGDRYRLQLAVYSMVVRKILGDAPEKTVIVRLGDKKPACSVYDANYEEAFTKITSCIQGINLGHFPSNRGWQCKWCGYRERFCSEEAQQTLL